MSISESITLDQALDVLNRLVEEDTEAITELVESRAECNEVLAEDPTVQVAKRSNYYEVGLLGVLNGLFGIDDNGYGPIAACFSVRCSYCSKELPKDIKEGDGCPHCRREIVEGDIIEFIRTPTTYSREEPEDLDSRQLNLFPGEQKKV